jgi:hypothetical protein
MLEAPTHTDHAVRGALLAALAIPITVLVFAILGSLGWIAGIVAALVPVLAAWFYRLGSGHPLGRSGLPAFFLITGVGVLLSVFTGLVSAFRMSVQAPAPLLSWLFWDEFLRSFGAGTAFEMVWLPTVVGLVLGGVGAIGVLRAMATDPHDR